MVGHWTFPSFAIGPPKTIRTWPLRHVAPNHLEWPAPSTQPSLGVKGVAEQFSFDSRCPKCNLLAHQQADADTLKTDLESDEFRLYCIRCD